MTALCFICLALLILSLMCSKERLFSPAVITSGIWFVCVVCFTVFDHGLYPVSSKFCTALTIWCSCFCISSLSVQSISFKTPYNGIVPSRTMRDIYFYFCIATLPLMILQVIAIFRSGYQGNMFHLLRMANVYGIESEGIARTATFFIPFWQITYLIELSEYSKQNRGRVCFLALLNIFYIVVSMSKTVFLIFFLSTMFMLLFKKRIAIKHVIIGGICLIFIFFVLQTIRAISGQEVEFGNFLRLYVLTSIPAFEMVEPCSSAHWGENSFRFVYAIANRLHLSSIEPIDPVLAWAEVPVPTNVYTVMYPFYKDFGFVGVGIFAAVSGAIFGWIYKCVEQGSLFAAILYAILSICLFMQIMGDIFFTTLSQNIQYILIAILPFFVTKYSLLKRTSYD